MTDLQNVISNQQLRLSTAIQLIPHSGKYMIVGSVPGTCYDFDKRRSYIYDTIEECRQAVEDAGVLRYQLPNCEWNTSE